MRNSLIELEKQLSLKPLVELILLDEDFHHSKEWEFQACLNHQYEQFCISIQNLRDETLEYLSSQLDSDSLVEVAFDLDEILTCVEAMPTKVELRIYAKSFEPQLKSRFYESIGDKEVGFGWRTVMDYRVYKLLDALVEEMDGGWLAEFILTFKQSLSSIKQELSNRTSSIDFGMRFRAFLFYELYVHRDDLEGTNEHQKNRIYKMLIGWDSNNISKEKEVKLEQLLEQDIYSMSTNRVTELLGQLITSPASFRNISLHPPFKNWTGNCKAQTPINRSDFGDLDRSYHQMAQRLFEKS